MGVMLKESIVSLGRMPVDRQTEKGMTLIEVVLTLVLSSLFFCCALQFVTTGTKFYVKTREMQQLRLRMNQVKLVIEEQYQEAEQVCVYVFSKNFEDQAYVDCVHNRHNDVPVTEEDYDNQYLSHIVYTMPKEMQERTEEEEEELPKETTTVSMTEKEKEGEKVFKIGFQGEEVISNYLKIKTNYKNQQVRLDITIFNDTGETLEDTLQLDLRYKL